jgi:hypothetical protein
VTVYRMYPARCLSFGYDPVVTNRRRFVCYFYHNGFDCIQLGVHISLYKPNLEIHVPFGFLRIGWDKLGEYGL